MTFFKNTIKNGTVGQLSALEKLGKANVNVSGFGSAEKASIFEGNFKNFKGTDLSNVFNEKELKALFTILDADGDGKLNETEVAKMAVAGGAKGAGKVDKNDLTALMKDAKNYAASNNKPVEEKKSVKKLKNGGKIVTVTKPDGSKVVSRYNAAGKKTSRVKTDANGDKTTTKYEYIKGHLVNSTSKTTRVVNGKKVTVSTEETRYNEKGKKDKSVKKDASGNILSTTDYKYNKNGKLIGATELNADGSKAVVEYDPATGKRKSKVTTSADGQTKSRIDYDSKTGLKKSKSVEKYDENGNLASVCDYTYRPNGKYATRVEYDANKNIVSKSSYDYKKDGSMVRTDRDADGKKIGSMEFTYDKYGRRTGSVTKDADGNVTAESSRKYYTSGVLKEETSVKYNEDGTNTKAVKHYNNDGKLTSLDKTDKTGETKTQTYQVNETKLKDLPKLDRKALEKKYTDSAEEMGKKMYNWAKQFLGYNEANGKYKKFTNGGAFAWCAAFASYCVKNFAKENGYDVKSGFGSYSVSGLREWAQNKGIFKNTKNMSNAQKLEFARNELHAGDVIIWKENGRSHTGIVTGVKPDGTYTTIEGNSSDAVKERSYNILSDKTLTGFIPLSKIYKG
ncbi:MAG: CHAP domain-containing protein [Candidatus Gastranaerophilales bacterium]|nr:CHAP domain-containing protein [Candidatus Gastranaerophilales bacterium]